MNHAFAIAFTAAVVAVFVWMAWRTSSPRASRRAAGFRATDARVTRRDSIMLIGLAGYAGCGKDTIAAKLVEDYGFERLAFADKLKEIAAQALHITTQELEREKTRYRDALVCLGAGMRIHSPDYWITVVESRIRRAFDRHVVVTDIRYTNEAKMIQRHNGRVYFVSRPNVGPANEEERTSLESVLKLPDLTIIHNRSTVDHAIQQLGILPMTDSPEGRP